MGDIGKDGVQRITEGKGNCEMGTKSTTPPTTCLSKRGMIGAPLQVVVGKGVGPHAPTITT